MDLMKKSINAWTIPSTYTFEETLKAAKEAGFDAIELNLDRANNGHSFTLETTDDEIKAVKKLADDIGIKICSVSSSLHNGIWCFTEPEKVAYARSVLTQQLKIAQILDAGAILLVPGGMPDGKLISESRANSIKNLKDAIPEIKASGIKVGLENVWNGFFLSPYDMVSFIDELESDVFGAYFDLGNMVAFSDTVHWADILATRTVRIHIKDYKRHGNINGGGVWCQLLEGDVDYKRAMAILKHKGFDGYLTAEVSKSDPNMSDMDYFKSIVAAEEIIASYYELA